MHEPVRQFIASQVSGETFGRVVEVGGRDLNGGVSDLIDADEYVSVDLYEGPGVDVVADVVEWAPGQVPADLVVCCEVLEHAPDADEVTAACCGLAGGRLLVTCATDPRAPHSGIAATGITDGEFYRNVKPADLVRWIEDSGLTVETVDTSRRGDLYVAARRV